MDRIKEGIIEIDGVVLSGETTIEDLEKIDIDKAVFRMHQAGYLESIFHHPIVNDGVEFQVSMRITRKGHKAILLTPKLKQPLRDALDASKEKQEICEQWLKRNMDVPPTRDTDDGIFYDFPWGHLYSAAAQHISFGHLEGCILLSFGEEAN